MRGNSINTVVCLFSVYFCIQFFPPSTVSWGKSLTSIYNSVGTFIKAAREKGQTIIANHKANIGDKTKNRDKPKAFGEPVSHAAGIPFHKINMLGTALAYKLECS